MKTFFCSLMILMFSTSAYAAEVLSTFDTPTGEPAYLMGEHPAQESFAYVSFGKLWVEKNGKNYRIAHDGAEAILKVLCYPYKETYPHTYKNLESRNFGVLGVGFERAVTLNGNGEIVNDDQDDLVMVDGSCAKEME